MQRHSAVLLGALLLGTVATAGPVAGRVERGGSADLQALRDALLPDPAGVLRQVRAMKADRRWVRRMSADKTALLTLDRIEGEALRRVGRPAEAEALFRRLLARVRGVAPGSELHADILLSLGSIRAEDGAIADALVMFQQAFRVYGDARRPWGQARALTYIAFLYDDAKDYSSAARYLRQAQDLDWRDPALSLSIENNLAGALKELGQYDEADTAYRAALANARARKEPGLEARILGGLARTALLRGDADAADRLVDAGLTLTEAEAAADARPPLLTVQARIRLAQGRARSAARIMDGLAGSPEMTGSSPTSREMHESAWLAYSAADRPSDALRHLALLRGLDERATKLATSTAAALMTARFDFANQELRIANLKAEELRRNAEYARAQTDIERLILAATLTAVLLLSVGLFTIRRSRNKVRAVNDELEASNVELNRALAARTNFLATTSHEIRTPLNGILGMTQVILADDGVAASTRERVELVHAAGMTMRALVDDILDAAKIEAGRLTVERAPFDLRAVLREACLLWEQPIRSKGVGFRYDFDVDDAPALGDAARVRQVVFNLLSNAAKFTSAGTVSLTARWDGSNAVISVSDTGVGIAPDKLEEIFESFRQADAGVARRFGGTGLGLSISRALARAMDGEISVYSGPGTGSVFSFVLPLRPAPAVEEAEPAATTGPTPLLIADAGPISRVVLRNLAEGASVPVVAVASSADAVAWLAVHRARAVLADISALGDREGRAAAAATLAEAAAAQDSPVLLLVGPDGAEDLPGIAHRVAKPVPGDVLLRRIESLCTAGQSALVPEAA